MTADRSTDGDADGDAPPEDRLHYVADVEAFEEADRRRVLADVEGREVALFELDGEYYAVANYCVHQGGPVCEGTLSGTLHASVSGDGWDLQYGDEGAVVACPWHGWEFDITSGEHLADPRFRLPTYDVVVRDGSIYVVL